MTRSNTDLLRFVAASFPSVWALEILLVLRSERRMWPRAELISALRASDLVVSRAMDALVAAGLASLEKDGAIYLPIDDELDECIGRAEELYRSRPNAVRRAIVATNTGSAAAFADAFRLRRGRDD